ncbi:MAG: hypothetical protein K0S32_1115 [Bacteroidetes bacterium]|nr:hypothetical protein [Bacteroidota bacterium]
MKRIIIPFLFLLLINNLHSQNVGDTIVVKGFKYGSNTRDSVINFPTGSTTFEKIILKYNMRCKNNLISNQANPNQGCGEWDYSCNTYIVDSSRIENDLVYHPTHIVSNFTGTVFPYTTQTLYDYYNYSQTNVVLNNIISETQYTVGTGGATITNLLKSNEKSGRTQILYTAAELTSAGFSAGNIDGFFLKVANAGGVAGFFKVGIQHTSLTALVSNTVTLTGFTNVYNSTYTFTNGDNRIQFHTPFVWNGTSNILIDYSFTNTQSSTAITLNGTTGAGNMALYSNNNYALDLASMGHSYINPAQFTSINNEITITFWAFGRSNMMPLNTSVVYGYGTSSTQRHLNVHLPWSDNSVYFDCGYNNGYDRINGVTTATAQGGQWNHWAFTKNATTGDMKIYLNGVLFQSGTGKTKPLSILTMILGKDENLLNNWKGKVNEFTVWNKELSSGDIQNWINKPIDNTHPFYSNLLAYYKMSEGTGSVINDSKNALTSTGVNVQWTYDPGHKLTRSFYETNTRPNIVFFNGTYATTNTTVTVKDSVARNPEIVTQYSIVSNATVVPMAHDAVTLVTTQYYYQAVAQNVYNGDNGTFMGIVPVTQTGTLTIGNLPYYKRYPYYNEIMSFVTPYGKGLSLGPNGKTWYYDITDYTPILKGPKRLLMTMGGEWQEQMDLDFLFIVGTPPRTILEFNQLWQGGARYGGVGIGSINNDTRFNTLNVPLLSGGKDFKMRSTITGHGAQGEFHQNGGTIFHSFNVNGGADEFTWPITQECSMNPIFPQGGTWIYDRQGWCPGETSLTKEYLLTPHVTPGTTVTLDYNCSNPPVPSGDYRYICAHQLVTYGAPNHNLDASVINVIAPTDRVLHSRRNPICSDPLIIVQNTGSITINGIDFEYWCNNATVKQTYSWAGTLNSMDTVTVKLPVGSLWQNDILPGTNRFNAKVKFVNALADDYAYNDRFTSTFVVPDAVPGNFAVEFKTNNYPTHNTYTITDNNGNIVGSNSFTAANTVHTDYYLLNGCYTLIVDDIVGDGLQWWAVPAQGAGYVALKDQFGNLVKSFGADFGSRIEYSFTTDEKLSIHENSLSNSFSIYPNPAHNKFVVQGNDVHNSTITITDVLGHLLDLPVSKSQDKFEYNTSNLAPGVYFLTIVNDGNKLTRKIIVN